MVTPNLSRESQIKQVMTMVPRHTNPYDVYSWVGYHSHKKGERTVCAHLEFGV